MSAGSTRPAQPCAAPAGFWCDRGVSETAEIVTEGEGHHEQLADRAHLDLSYEAVGPDRAAAVAELGRRVSGAAGVLERPGLSVRSRRLWVRTEWKGRRERGCRAGERIRLQVVDLGVLEPTLADLLATAPAQISGPDWSLADPAPAARAAQRHAVTDARERAEGYADALGMRLGPLVRLADGGGAPVTMRAGALRSAAEPDIEELGLEPEPVRVTARCTTTWALAGM